MRARIWIAWENQRRNVTLSEALEAKLFQFDFKLNRQLRYPLAFFKTLFILLQQKPNLIFVQNPSLLLALFAVNYGKLLKIPVVVDSHNAGLFPFDGTKEWANILARHIIKAASLTFVTNDRLKNYIDQLGGTSFVLPDPIPNFSVGSSRTKMPLQGRCNVLFICSYASDEPYLEVIQAATELKEDIVIYMTGNSKGRLGTVPQNVVLTGYLPEHEYLQLLYAADIVIDLTTRENCLVCGAYEAVAAEKPAILSDTKVLREYFYKGALYVDNTSADIVKKINDSFDNLDKLKQAIKELKKERIESWGKSRLALEELFKKMVRGGSL